MSSRDIVDAARAGDESAVRRALSEVRARGPRDDAEHAYVVLERVEGERALAPEFAGEVPSGWWSGARE